MKTICKFKPEIVKFLVNSKLKNPDISCRKLALEASEKFHVKLSKSAISNIFKKEKLSSPVGRRSRQAFHAEGERHGAGFYILKAMDELLGLSKTTAEVLINVSPALHKSFTKDIENIVQALIIYKSMNNTTLDFSTVYDNNDAWQIVARRPSRTVYNRIVKILQSPQLFVEELVREIRQRLNPISGFRFRLKDGSNFFIDAGLNSVWPMTISNSLFSATYYKSNSYINEIINQEGVISIFNVQDINIFYRDVLDFILAFEAQDPLKQIRQIELIGAQENVINAISEIAAKKRFFLLGFWPWQLDIMSEFERKPAKDKFISSDLGIEYYYQLEEVLIPQHLVNKELRLTAIILKNSPLGAARIGILTNIARNNVLNFLSYKNLYHWFSPEERYKDFTKKDKTRLAAPLISLGSKLSNILMNKELDNIIGTLSEIALEQFKQYFLPAPDSLAPENMNNIFSQQKVTLKTTREFLIHNFIINNELWKQTLLKYTCQRLNETGIKDSQKRLLLFQIK